MPRIPRVVIPGVPHHIVERGRRGKGPLKTDADRRRYLALLAHCAPQCGLSIVAYCLMSDHVHLVGVPRKARSLSDAMTLMGTRYSKGANRARRKKGPLWCERFKSCPIEDRRLREAVRYVERCPVRAGVVIRAERYPWSSAAGHAGRRKDPVLADGPGRKVAAGDWGAWLYKGDTDAFVELMRRKTRTGRPLGSDAFIARLERLTGRILHLRKAGRPRKKRPSPGRKARTAKQTRPRTARRTHASRSKAVPPQAGRARAKIRRGGPQRRKKKR